MSRLQRSGFTIGTGVSNLCLLRGECPIIDTIDEIHSLNLRLGAVEDESLPGLFSSPGDINITKDPHRRLIRVQPKHPIPVRYPLRPIPLHQGGHGVPAVMLLPPNHPHYSHHTYHPSPVAQGAGVVPSPPKRASSNAFSQWYNSSGSYR
jgi:hypothetical protein